MRLKFGVDEMTQSTTQSDLIICVDCQSQYILVKRTNQTIFLNVEPSDSVEEVNRKLSAIIQAPVETIRLVGSDQKTPLQAGKSLSELKVEPESSIYWVLSNPDGSWEDVNIQKIDKVEDKQ
ncbi:ubiquitin family protein [Planoprotostelium fungivorum]|uniref:Ubiquitin family protein n=1 Tax=Planoprotostelium fungivorum TaxID=1890364 RepID=A0A2P6NLR7_9EUKA|nr:ubiquitin family protein [Planoprotostelium fungivorum]